MITIDGDRVVVETKTLTACFTNGWLTSLRSKHDGEEFIPSAAVSGSAVGLVYPGAPLSDVAAGPVASIQALSLSPHRAQFRLHGWDSDGVLDIAEDPETGDLLIEPSAYSSRTGALACRWSLPRVREDLDLVAPFFQGVRLRPDDPLLQRRWFWPQFWEAGLAIFQGAESGFWIHCRDDRYRYKALNITNGVIGMETDAYGPLEHSPGAGGLTWRINVYRGDWQTPATLYRDWLWDAYALRAAEQTRLAWTRDILFAVSWYHGDPDLLDALATRLNPAHVLLHYADWRTDGYDENYPTYVPSDAARAVFAKAQAMGFHVMPHCNAVDMDPTHPVYALIRDFQYRDVQTRGLLGWGYDMETHQVLGVPNSYRSLSRNRARKVMIKVHPGLAMWRSLLAESIRSAADAVQSDTVFTDVTLCSHNLHNALVENTTSTEGMKRLLGEIASLGEGLAVGGEGLNEITMQDLSFAQAHLFTSWQDNCEGVERTGGCPLNAFLFGRLCRTFGYSGLSGKTEAEALRMRLHEELGAIPTVTVRTAEEILNPNPAVRRALEIAEASR